MPSEKAAANWLENPWVPYALIGLGVVGVIVILPWLFGRIFKGAGDTYNAAKKGATAVATDIIDTGASTIGEISSIVGKPSTELPGQQSFGDKLKGLLAGGDSRTWSDLLS